MRTRLAVVGPIAVLCFFTPAVHAQIAAKYAVKGQASWEGATITLQSAVTHWDARRKELQVGLFPFDVTDEDVKKVVYWGQVFNATAGKPSPNPAKWKVSPYLVIRLYVDGDKKAYTLDDVNAYTLVVILWKGNNPTGIGIVGAEIKQILKEFSFSPNTIKDLKIRLSETKDRERLAGFRYEGAIPAK